MRRKHAALSTFVGSGNTCDIATRVIYYRFAIFDRRYLPLTDLASCRESVYVLRVVHTHNNLANYNLAVHESKFGAETQDGNTKIPEGDEVMQDDRAGGASTSRTPLEVGELILSSMEAEGSGVEGFHDTSKGSDANKAGSSMGSPADQIAAVEGKRQASVPLDEVLKGLIISQVRAPFANVQEGIVSLIKECLIADSLAVFPFYTHAALCGHVDHFDQSADDEDLGWGCGWRNIQTLCSFLLAEDPESREVLFNGAGFVPDIPALQLWLEIAWSKGFDEPGAKFFNWSISGTRKWIGTTECAALLRSFGVRARIVSFTALGKRARNNMEHKGGSYVDLSDSGGIETSDVLTEGQAEPANSRGGGETESATSQDGISNCDECGKICHQGSRYSGIVDKDSNLCDDCMKAASQKGGDGENRDVNDDNDIRLDSATPDNNPQRHVKLLARDLEHQWSLECNGCGEPLRGRRYKSLMKRDFEICAKCMKGIEENPQERRSTKNFVIIEVFPAIRCNGPPGEDDEHGKDVPVISHEEAEEDHEEEGASQGEPENIEGKDFKVANDEQTTRERGGNADVKDNERNKAGMRRKSSGVKYSTDHHHLIEWVWSYFTEDSSARRFSEISTNSREMVTMSKRSPLYFQHLGHSRIIVGIERRRKPDGISEHVYLLVLDPSLSTGLLVKSLREKTRWQEFIKNDVQSLKEADYQLCYADPGIATGEELEQIKVLSSLRYSYY